MVQFVNAMCGGILPGVTGCCAYDRLLLCGRIAGWSKVGMSNVKSCRHNGSLDY